MVGAAQHIIIGKHNGSKALRNITQRMGYYLKDEELVDLSERMKICSDFKHAINCEELRNLILNMENIVVIYPGPEDMRLCFYTVSGRYPSD